MSETSTTKPTVRQVVEDSRHKLSNVLHKYPFTTILINGKEMKSYVVDGSYYYFCFFCGKNIGRGISIKHLKELCAKENVKRFKNPAYDGERWVCKPCRDMHRHDFEIIENQITAQFIEDLKT